MSEDLTYDPDDATEPEEIHEGVSLAGSDVDVPADIEERLKDDAAADDEELDD